MFLTDSILPPAPEGLTTLHDREYRVRAYRIAADRVLLQGGVRDQKPPHLYVRDDPDPLTIHHMQVSLEVAFPTLEIVAATVHFEMHPKDTCPSIVEHYDRLVGLSIARGFTHHVRELFGGPRGCTHTTALLQAMAPVAVQCFWSMRAASDIDAGTAGEVVMPPASEDDAGLRTIIDTCHVWAADGDAVRARRAGHPETVPVFLRERLRHLGITRDRL